MKKILVPTDFSECADAALEYAAAIAKKTAGEIFLVHIIDVPGISANYSGGEWTGSGETSSDVHFMMALMNRTKSKMKTLLDADVLKGVKVTDHVEVGTTSERVKAAAEKYNADIIVMGTHGSSGVNEVFAGSNAEKIVRLSGRPVLSIKEKNKNPNIRKIIFASDFYEEAHTAFASIKQFAEMMGANIVLLKVNTIESFETTRESVKTINNFLARYKGANYPVSIYNDIVKEAGIIHFSADSGADIIALGTHGRRGISHFFSGSIAEDVVNHSFLPVLTVNIPKK